MNHKMKEQKIALMEERRQNIARQAEIKEKRKEDLKNSNNLWNSTLVLVED